MNAPAIVQQLLTVSPWNRPGIQLVDVRGIVLHWTADPRATARDMRNFFENLKTTHFEVASAHFGISQNGEIIQMVPIPSKLGATDGEVSYTSGWYCYSDVVNKKLGGADLHRHIISIEVCPIDSAGNYSPETMAAQTYLSAWLLDRFALTTEDLYRHYDMCGEDGIHAPKDCPKLFVDYPQKWEQFKHSVAQMMGAA